MVLFESKEILSKKFENTLVANSEDKEIDGEGKFLMPGLIDIPRSIWRGNLSQVKLPFVASEYLALHLP